MAKRKGDGKRNRTKSSNKSKKKDERLQRVAAAMHERGPRYVTRGQNKKSRQKRRKKEKLWRDRKKDVASTANNVASILHSRLIFQREYYLPSGMRSRTRYAGSGTTVYVYQVLSKRSLQMRDNSAPFNVKTLFHGTRLHNLPNILREGQLIPSSWGLLGPGIYLGKLDKALAFARSHDDVVQGVVLECSAACGNEFDSPRYYREELPQGYHSKIGRSGITRTWGSMTLRNDEWAIPYPQQVVIKAIHILWNPPSEE